MRVVRPIQASRQIRDYRPTALPRRFRRMRVVIIGCGDVGLRMLDQFSDRASFLATARREDQCRAIRARRARPIRFDLDAPGWRRCRPEQLATRIIYMAPPSPTHDSDPRLARSLARAVGFERRRLIYTSTTGVFGHAQGRRLTETSPPNPTSARAKRRLSAERRLRRGTTRGQIAASILRIPGIYAVDRLPGERLERGSPAITADQDSYSNHINADDLATVLWMALFRAQTNRLYIASDGQDIRMGDYFDQVADALALPRPERLSAEQVREQVSPMMWSFLAESRRLCNRRLRDELRITLRYPTVTDTLKSLDLLL